MDPGHTPGAAAPGVPALGALPQTRLDNINGDDNNRSALSHLVTSTVHITELEPGGGCPKVTPNKHNHVYY